MSGSSRLPDLPGLRESRAAVWAAYVVLGAALLWSRLYSLGHSFWTDEILMVERFVRPGLREILTGQGLTHQLMAILCWIAANTVGESELVFRLFSAVPFVAGVVLVTAWLHVRLGALSGLLYLFLATASPLLLDITRQARGYGLAFLATSVMVVAAVEALRTGSLWAVLIMWIGGLTAAWTLPQAGIAVLATAAVLTLDRRTRVAAAAGLAIVLVAIGAWYVPHRDAVEAISRYPDGVQIGFPWVVTAPIDQVVLPGLLWIDGTALLAGAIWLPLVVLVGIVGARSPFLRDWRIGLCLLAGPVATALVLWIAGSHVIPRYLSYLLAPLFIVLATGAAATLREVGSRKAIVGPVVCLVAIGLLAVRFVTLAPDVVGLPREALRDTASVIDEGPPGTPVLAYMRNATTTLGFYLERPIEQLDEDNAAARICAQRRPVFYVEQLDVLDPVTIPCLGRPSAQLTVLRQYTRGDEIRVWLVPPDE
jgi:hypothetical protein